MRITNNMMMRNTKLNINGNKENVNTLNNLMSSQKKIDKPSEDPVVAIRSLRLRSSLSQINQYYEKNIPDAESWLEVTETALTNMRKVLTDIHTLCVNGANDTLAEDDRDTILTQLQSLADQVYAEGNSDYAGRTVFTGYKTNTMLTFSSAEADTTYNINQYFSASSIEEHTYPYNSLKTPTSQEISDAVANGTVPEDPSVATVQRVRLAYDGLSALNSATYDYTLNATDGSTTTVSVDLKAGTATSVTIAANGTTTTTTVGSGFTYSEMTTKELENIDYAVGEDEVVYNQETGELLLGANVAKEINSMGAMISVNYDKTGFSKGDLKPENYYDCTNMTDPDHPIVYTNYNEDKTFIEQDINYTVAMNQTLTVNTVANNVFDSSIGRDVDELIDAVKNAIYAHESVAEIESMLTESQYSSPEMQAKLKEYLAAAERQRDYADQQMKQLYSSGITKFDDYMAKVNLAITDVGNRGDRLDVIKSRMASQQTTVKSLKSNNEDKELSDIVIDYTSAYTSYQASLQAAAKVEKQTLLDYL